MHHAPCTLHSAQTRPGLTRLSRLSLDDNRVGEAGSEALHIHAHDMYNTETEL